MIKILQFIPIQLTFFLVLGIIFNFYFDVNIVLLPYFLLSVMVVLLISYWQSNKSFYPSLHFNILTYILCFIVGITTSTIHNNLHNKLHYSHFITGKNSIVLVIDKVLKPSKYHIKYEAKVVQVATNKTKGIILLNIKKDSLTTLQVDDKIYLNTSFVAINKPKNPYSFNYKKYLENKHIYHQIFTSKGYFLTLSKRTFSLKGLAAKFRKIINTKLTENGFKNDELGVINALLLGQRQNISSLLLRQYASAGAIHILAVSGLHIGIILFILNFLFTPLEQLKKGKIIKLIVVVFLLWVFAFVAGMTASVVRAVTMFTAVAIGMHVNKPTNTYNTLIISMFFLLLFKPSFLFDVGFQLSYLAVFFIVWLQPILSNLLHPKYKIFNFLWQLFTVSTAAQIGVLPLSLYYFHQFPSLFFISNLVIVPFLGLLLGFGVLVIALALLNALPTFVAKAYYYLIYAMNWLVSWVAQQEEYLIKNISFSLLMVIASYILIIFVIQFLEKRTAKRFIVFLGAVLLLQSVFIYEKKKRLTTDEFIVFNKNKASLIASRSGENIQIFHTIDSVNFTLDKVLNNYFVGVGNLQVTYEKNYPNVHLFKNKRILIVDSLGVYQLKNIKPEIVVLQQSPKINLTRLIDALQPKIIIADGSNYKTYKKKWQVTCVKKNTPFYDVSQKGAFVLKD